MISIWYGCGKPVPVNDFLLPFVNELNDLLRNGIVINGHQITIKIRCFICDTPARSLLKGKYNLTKRFISIEMMVSVLIIYVCAFVAIVNFNSYFGCQKCNTRGKYFNQFRVLSFPHIDADRRTDRSFRNREQIEHHKDPKSVLEELDDCDMVADFVTSDPLHLLDLGLMKRCLTRWVDGTKSYKNKFTAATVNRVNSVLFQFNCEMPSEIHRAVRDLSTIHFWKGTEFRTFLLYLGIIVLKGAIPIEEYKHFILLNLAVKICSSDVYKNIVHKTTLVEDLLSNYHE